MRKFVFAAFVFIFVSCGGSPRGTDTPIVPEQPAPWNKVANPFPIGNHGSIRETSVGATSGSEVLRPVGLAQEKRGVIGTTLHSVWGRGPDDVYVVGEASTTFGLGNLLHSDGSGLWQAIDTGTKDPFFDIWGDGGSHVVAVGGVYLEPGAEASIFESTDGGGTWTLTRHPSLGPRIEYTWGARGATDYYLGSFGGYFHVTGTTWTPIPYASTTSRPWSPSSHEIFTGWGGCCKPSTVFHSNDGGLSYEHTSLPTNGPLFAIWGYSDVLYAAGAYIAVSLDRGQTWRDISPPFDPIGVSARAIWGSSAYDLYVVGESGLILHTTDGGATWRHGPTGFDQVHFFGVWGSAQDDVYIVGTSGTILHGSLP